ncbi:twin-arginine translocase subunit TatC [Hahella sp. KA22]|uniref:twin-arginine translocase subunit TatC n=1 Tax=Hahella sp. KA22 TaxID=1628392 RepID=UPI001F4EE629|nr:twin-arginine translocase subunit TatC [Hahella sp. KA22]
MTAPEMTPRDDNADKELPLFDHLVELRNRLLHSVLAVLVAFLPLYAFRNEIYAYLAKPLRAAMPEGATMIATEVASPFLAPFKLTMVLAIFLMIPFILYQIWSFIAPALYKHEKKLAIPLLVSSVLLFYLGVAFAYYVVFPLAFNFFASASPEGVTVMTDINKYLDFILKLFFAFGFAFEIPIATVLMVKVGLTNVASLREKRPYIVVICFIIGMLLTPPDVISQTLLAVPMWLLFEVGVLCSRWVEPTADSNSESINT